MAGSSVVGAHFMQKDLSPQPGRYSLSEAVETGRPTFIIMKGSVQIRLHLKNFFLKIYANCTNSNNSWSVFGKRLYVSDSVASIHVIKRNAPCAAQGGENILKKTEPGGPDP